MKNTQKGFAIPLIIALVALIAIGGGVYIYNQNNYNTGVPIDIHYFTPNSDLDELETNGEIEASNDTNNDQATQNEDTDTPPVTETPTEPVFCAEDAFQCPDGSWVGRTGPNCEFVCPYNNTVRLHVVNVKSFYTKPQINNDKEIINLSGSRTGEYVKINVTGEIHNFRYSEISYNDKSNSFIEVKTLKEIPNVYNKYILINTVLPGGMPFEKISWESINGEKYEMLLSESGITGEINQEFILE